MNMSEKEPVVLVVEDSDDDFEYTQKALKEAGLTPPLFRCENGQQALDYLLHRAPFNANNAPLPELILLDLNMPGVGGHEVLDQIKTNETLKGIPVVILTTSANDVDIKASYKNGANSYITKPVDLDAFFVAISRLKDYWFNVAVLPNRQIA